MKHDGKGGMYMQNIPSSCHIVEGRLDDLNLRPAFGRDRVLVSSLGKTLFVVVAVVVLSLVVGCRCRCRIKMFVSKGTK
jgi:hypothetical protein